MRVPGFVNWLGRISPKKIDSTQHIIDWLPTIAAIIGAEPSMPEDRPGLDGEDFSELLLTDAKPKDDEREIHSIHRPGTDKWAVRRGNWKVVKHGKEEPTESSHSHHQ
jgi:arylsulfatase A-like enzyme